jgi:hypothetical protein
LEAEHLGRINAGRHPDATNRDTTRGVVHDHHGFEPHARISNEHDLLRPQLVPDVMQ